MTTSSSTERSQFPRLTREASSDHAAAKEEGDTPAKSPPWPMRVWAKLGLNYGILSTMFKYVFMLSSVHRLIDDRSEEHVPQ